MWAADDHDEGVGSNWNWYDQIHLLNGYEAKKWAYPSVKQTEMIILYDLSQEQKTQPYVFSRE